MMHVSPLHAGQSSDALAGAPLGILSIRECDDRGVIRVWGWGSWTPDYVDAHFAELIRHADAARAAGRPVCILTNLQKSAPQSPEAAARIHAGINALFRPGDRIALVLDSSVTKRQLHQRFDRTKINLFISETAAALWLMPDALPQAAAARA